MGVTKPSYVERAGSLSVYVYAEDGTTQIALFTYASHVTTLEGGDTSGDDLIVKCNSAQSYCAITLLGGAQMQLSSNGTYEYYKGTDLIGYMTNASNVTTMTGGNVTGDDFKLKAGYTDDYPYIQLYGNAGIVNELKATATWVINEETSLRLQYSTSNQNLNIGAVAISNDYDLGLFKDGVLCLKEGATPTADANYGKLYCKNDDKLYWQDGAGVEHEVAYA